MHVVRRFIVIPVGRRAAVATLSNRRSVSTSTSLSPYSSPLPRWQRLRDAARRGATSEAEAAARAVLQADGAAAAVAVAAYTQLLWAYAADRDPDGVHAVARRAALLTPPEHPGLDAAVVREAARVARARAAAGCGVAVEPAQPAAAPSAQLQEAAAAHGFEAAYALALRFAHGEGGEGEKRRAAAAARSAGVAYALLGAARRAGQAAQVARAYELPGRLRAGTTGEVGGAGGGGFCGSPQFLRAAMEASCNECDDPGAGLRLYHLRASEAHRRSFAVARSYVACLLRMTEGEQEVEEEAVKGAEWWNAECRRRLRRSRRRRRYNSGGDVTEATTARASRAVAAAEQEGAGQDSEPRARGVGRSQAQHAVPAYVGLARLAARRRDLPLVEVEAALRHVFWRARKHGGGGADVVREQLEAVYRRRAQTEGASPVLSPPLHYGGCGADERRKKR
eukprot:Rhum_TRINITY_DN13122_c0_g1::Rhum_TRINITY_DN13122_c0_g1_i1::g.57244::m.57244